MYIFLIKNDYEGSKSGVKYGSRKFFINFVESESTKRIKNSGEDQFLEFLINQVQDHLIGKKRTGNIIYQHQKLNVYTFLQMETIFTIYLANIY